MLEMIAHGIVLNEDYCMKVLEIPDDKIKTINPSDLPANWFVYPAPEQLKSIGNAFIAENKYLAIRLPSAVNRQESNVLINPKHGEFKKVKVVGSERVAFDRFD
jgi:RES domain-containing protein